MSVTAKITSKGQLTLPRHIRKMLTTNTVELEIEGDRVILTPVRSVAGALAKYATEATPLTDIRNQVWQEVADGGKS